MQYNTVICGGTFDRLHEGHKYFLRHIFSVGKRVLIGLTSDTYGEAHKKGHVLSFQERLEELKTFLAEEGLLIRAEIFPIQDVYGKAIDPSVSLDAIVVSETTVSGGKEINRKREEIGLSSLPLVTIPLLSEGDRHISSTEIREGKIGRHGEIYLDEKWTTHLLQLPVPLRKVLHKPFHTLLTGPIPTELVANPDHIVTVGDATTKRLNQEEVGHALSVIDFSVKRESLYHAIEELGFKGTETVIHGANPSGHIAPEMWGILRTAIHESEKKRVVVEVAGEEDLLVIPLILLLPLGWKLFYGQPKEGLVYVPITEEVKKKVYDFLLQFVRK